MIKSLFKLLFLLSLFFFFSAGSIAGKFKIGYDLGLNISQNSEVILATMVTTSRSAAWSPGQVVTDGNELEWTASADGFADQVVQTDGAPEFDLSLSRTSDVLITVTTINNRGGLIELIINSLNIKELSVEKSPSLLILSCTDNQIKSLELQNNTLLRSLYCHSNQLQELDVSQNLDLLNLACFSNQIPNLDFSNNSMIETISCSGNLLNNLDLTNNQQLRALECDFNNLQSLNIQNGNNTLIQKFNTKNNLELTCIQVDDANYSENNWMDIDSWTQFNRDCTFTNEPPVALDDSYQVDENMTLTVDSDNGVLTNDYDPDDDVLLGVLVDDVSEGKLDFFQDGSFQYTPAIGFFGSDTFTYVANDGEFDSNLAIVTLEIVMVNEAPIAVDDNYITSENTVMIVEEDEGVLQNDIDPDDDQLEAELLNQVSQGELIFSSDGSFTYSPNQNFFGVDQFSYRAFDGYDYSDEATVTISVEAISELIVPNAFTPNSDGLNDTFRPVYIGMSHVQLQIFDTWGVLIYNEAGKTLTGWNGLIKNRSAENGNYLYRIRAITNEKETLREEGIFTLIR